MNNKPNKPNNLDDAVMIMKLKQRYLPDRYPSKQKEKEENANFEDIWSNSINQVNSDMKQAIQSNQSL